MSSSSSVTINNVGASHYRERELRPSHKIMHGRLVCEKNLFFLPRKPGVVKKIVLIFTLPRDLELRRRTDA